MGTSTLSPFFQHQEPQQSEQAILLFDELPKAISRAQVYPVHVLSGGRPEVIYGISEGLTAAIRPHSESIATPFHQQLMEAFVSFVKDEGNLYGISVSVQMDPDTVAFITRLWGAVGFGVFGFNIRGMCSVRSVSRYGSYPTGSRQPVQDEFRHIVKSEALTGTFLTMRIKAFNWAVINVLDPVYVAKQKTWLEEVREKVSAIDGHGSELAHSYPLGMARHELLNPRPVAAW